MTASLRRLWITSRLVSIAFLLPATVGAQPPVDPSQRGSDGAVLVNDGANQDFNLTPEPGHRLANVRARSAFVRPVTHSIISNVIPDHGIRATLAVLGLPPVLEANQLRMFVAPGGSFAFDPVLGAPGLEFPKGSGKTLVFASGLWLGAMVNGSTRVTLAEYSDEFGPGAMVNGGPDDPRRPEYRVFRLDRQYGSVASRDSALSDYNSGALPHGAPAVSVLPNGELGIPGDEMLWHVCNDAEPTLHSNRAGGSLPLGVEVQQTAYAFNRLGALGNTAFVRFRIINKGSNLLEHMYAALWSDPDLGNFRDDLVGCDSARSLGYCYNGADTDAVYGSAPPAVGYDLLSVTKAGVRVPGHAATAFIQYLNGGDPQNSTQSYNFLRGRLASDSAITDPTTHQPTNYFYTGDPVAGTGWLDTNPSDRRMLLPSGPFTLAPSETLEVVGAIVIGDGTDRLSSITKLRNFDDQVQQFFDGVDGQLAMSFTLTPRTLNLASQGKWVTGSLEPTSSFAARDIDVQSIRLNGSVPVDPAAPTTLSGNNRLIVKFNRAAVELSLSDGDNVPVTVTGTIGNHTFLGTDHIRVRRAVVSAPAAGSHVTAGSLARVLWQMPAGPKVALLALLRSLDGGRTWSLIAGGQPNIGSYEWQVPNVSAQQARLALVTSADAGGGSVEGVIGVSQAFTIDAVTGVGDHGPAALTLAIRRLTPNPAPGGRLRVEFALRDASVARLELMDVAGRVLISKPVGTLGPGAHALDLSQGGALRPGIYFVRLTQGGSEATARAAVLR